MVELMVALLLGLFLMSGVTGMYISNKQTYRMTDNLSRLQESLRFGLEFISRDIRMAGYLPCRFPPVSTNAITNGDTSWYLDFFNYGIRGFEGSDASFPPAFLANAVAGSDAVLILKGGLYSTTVDFNNEAINTVMLQNSFPSTEFGLGEIAIICDPYQAAIFQISGRNSTAGILSYAPSSGIIPNNANTNIGAYGRGTQITPYEPVLYFIAPSTQNPAVNSLKKQYLEARYFNSLGAEVAQMREEELLEGVESMQILYGLDVDNDQIADRFEAANSIAASEWVNVITVRLGLLMATGQEVTNQIDTNSYNVAGTIIPAPTTPGDRRLRYVVNTTISLRNRLQ